MGQTGFFRRASISVQNMLKYSHYEEVLSFLFEPLGLFYTTIGKRRIQHDVGKTKDSV